MADYYEKDYHSIQSPWWVSAIVVATFFVIGWFANDVFKSYQNGVTGTGIPQVGVGGGPVVPTSNVVSPLPSEATVTPTVSVPTITSSPIPSP